jgi:hypothetical protein
MHVCSCYPAHMFAYMHAKHMFIIKEIKVIIIHIMLHNIYLNEQYTISTCEETIEDNT